MLLFKLTYQGRPADKKSFPKDQKVSDFLDHLCEISSIKLSELNLGIGPFVIGPVLEHKIGAAQVLAPLVW